MRIESGEALRVLVRTSDLFVSVPHSRPERAAIATAMWAGTPVVASDAPGVRELIESGVTGLVLPAGEPRRLARALRVVGRDSPARASWAWGAHRRAEEQLSPPGTAALVSLALDDAARHHAGRPAWNRDVSDLDGAAAG